MANNYSSIYYVIFAILILISIMIVLAYDGGMFYCDNDNIKELAKNLNKSLSIANRIISESNNLQLKEKVEKIREQSKKMLSDTDKILSQYKKNNKH